MDDLEWSSMKSGGDIRLPKAPAIKQFLQQNLSEDRRDHLNRVFRIMGEAAKIVCGLNESRAKLAGAFHDIARELPLHRLVEILKEYDPDTLTRLPEKYHHPFWLHGPAGAAMLKCMFEVDDAAILNAVKNHQFSFGGTEQLTAILHVADMAESVKPYQGRDKLKSWLLAGRISDAVLLLDVWYLNYFKAERIPVPPTFLKRIADSHARLRREKRLTPDFFART